MLAKHRPMIAELSVYGLLFISAFTAASVLTFPSEPILIGLVSLKGDSVLALWLIATTGNTAGAAFNWWLARYALRWQDKRWFPIKREQLDKASVWFQKHGAWTLLLAWLPIIGDPLTFAAGLLRVRLDIFLLLVGLGKAARYAFIIWATQAALI